VAVCEARDFIGHERILAIARVLTKRKTKTKFMVKEVYSLSPSQWQRFDDVQ